MAFRPRDPLKPIEVEEQHQLPIVWLIVGGLVLAGFISNFTINLFASGGLSVWPFVFAISTLLILNDLSDQNGVGVPPLQAYGLFLGVLVFLFGFVALISHVNPWVLMALVLLLGVFVARDWRDRKRKELEMAKRRLAGVCVRCLTPVKNDLDAECPECNFPVHPERLTLMRLGRAIAQAGSGGKMRETLAKKPEQRQAPKRASSNRPITKAYSYGKKK